MFERPKIIKSNAIFAPVSQKVYAIMNRDAIDFERDGVFSLFRKLLIPTLLGSVAMSAMSTIDGIFVGHGVGAAAMPRGCLGGQGQRHEDGGKQARAGSQCNKQ